MGHRFASRAVVVALVGVVGCTGVISGCSGSSGARRSTAADSGAGAPSAASPKQTTPLTVAPSTTTTTSASTPRLVASHRCPRIVAPAEQISFRCIDNALRYEPVEVWTVGLYRRVASANFTLNEGAASAGPARGRSLASVAEIYRRRMVVDDQFYFASPTMRTVSAANTTVHGTPAHILQTLVTLDPAEARKWSVDVRQIRLWIVALNTPSGSIAVWYTAIPDKASTLWAAVPATIASIRVY